MTTERLILNNPSNFGKFSEWSQDIKSYGHCGILNYRMLWENAFQRIKGEKCNLGVLLLTYTAQIISPEI